MDVQSQIYAVEEFRYIISNLIQKRLEKKTKTLFIFIFKE